MIRPVASYLAVSKDENTLYLDQLVVGWDSYGMIHPEGIHCVELSAIQQQQTYLKFNMEDNI